MKKLLCLLLAVCLITTTLFGCGQKSAGEFSGHKAIVVLPEKTDLEKLADLNASAAVQAYLTARTYLDDFLDYDIAHGNPDEYRALLDKTVAAFEEVNVLSESLKTVCDAWIEVDGMSAEKPVLTPMAARVQHMELLPLMTTTAYAAGEDNAAVAWAKEITARFDEAPAGRGVRTLAEHLGTDYKHAYAQLRQAQDILAGAAYEDFANTANEAYKTATYLKTAGTAAGFVIAVAAAPAPTAIGAAINTGGAVISGVNTLLELGSSGALFVTNGEGNWVSEACDKTEGQMAPIGAVFAVAGVATNVSGFMKNTDGIIKEGVGAGQSTKEILKTIGKSKELTDDAFGMISFTAGSLTELVNDKSVLGGTVKMDDNGKVKFTLVDTLLGRESSEEQEEKQPEIKDVLKEAGLAPSAIEEGLNADPAALSAEDTIPAEMRENIRSAAPALDPGSPEFDPEAAGSFARSIGQAVEKVLKEAKGIIEDAAAEEPVGEKWVEPYEYFGVSTSEELLPKLRSNGVTKLEVAPIVFDEKTGETRSLSNAEPFILDMADGAVTTFSTSFDHPMGESSKMGIDFTLTFTGGRGPWNGNYWSIDGVTDETWSNGSVDHEEFDDGILYDVNVDWFPEQFRQYIIMDVRITDFLGFKVQRVLLPE